MERGGRQTSNRGEYEQQLPDPFSFAYRPPQRQSVYERFLPSFDRSVEDVFDRAVSPVTRLKIDQANELRGLLGLNIVVIPKEARRGGIDNAKNYLRAAKSQYPGRLVYGERGDKRVAVMNRLVDVFTVSEHATIDDVVELFHGDPQAGLLLKGAVAEILRASIEGAADEWRRGIQVV